jgi:hypothetical protein
MVYEMLIPSIPFLALYLLTFGLYKGGIIKKAFHVNIWNFIIAGAFLISGGAGFLLMILMEMGFVSPINFGLMYWHVELGVTLVLVTVFHFHIYWKSSKKMFMGNKKTNKKEVAS